MKTSTKVSAPLTAKMVRNFVREEVQNSLKRSFAIRLSIFDAPKDTGVREFLEMSRRLAGESVARTV